jgi:hypothetical protein
MLCSLNFHFHVPENTTLNIWIFTYNQICIEHGERPDDDHLIVQSILPVVINILFIIIAVHVQLFVMKKNKLM